VKLAVATVVVALLALVGPATAQNNPTIGVERHSDRVVITVAGVSATGTAIPGDGYIDIPLAAGARAAAYIRIDDPTVRKVEVGDAKEPIVRVKLRTGQRQTQAIAGAVALVQVANGTQITIVRNPAAPAKAPEAAKAAPAARPLTAAAPVAPLVVPVAVPVPTAAPAPTPAAIAAQAPVAEAKAPVEATPDLTEPAAAGPAPAAASAPAGPPVTGIPAETARPLELAPTTGGGLPWTSIIVLIGVAAAGVLVVRKTRGQRAGADAPQMTMRATMSLGAKAKVVLLTADDRELLVAVDSKGVRLLDSWNRGEAAEAGPRGNETDAAEVEADGAAVAPDFASLVARVGGGRATTRAGTQTGAIPRLPTEGAVSQRMATQTGLSQRFKAPTEPPPRAQPRLVTRNDDLDDDLDDGRAPRARTSSDQISGLLRLRHAARAEDAAAGEPTEGESPWAQHLMASLRRGKPS
jgi:flagellar biogenesis protein FliO